MNTARDIVPLVATLIALGGFAFSVWSFRSTAQAHTLMAYAERYEKLVELLPREILLPQNEPQHLPERTEELRLACYRYLHLTMEEFYLSRKGYFPRDLWHIWEASMRRVLAHPIVVREWRDVRDQWSVYREFYAFVEDAQRATVQDEHRSGKQSVLPVVNP